MRLVYGELQVIPYNDAAAPDVDTSEASTAWRAVNASATGYGDLFIVPNGSGTTAGSVKLDYVTDHWQWGTAIASLSDSGRYALFSATTSAGLSEFTKMYLRAMAFLPEEGATDADYNGDGFWANNGAAERLPLRGGNWNDSAGAGVFALNLMESRALSSWNVGFRAALPLRPDTQGLRAMRQCEGDKGACFRAVQARQKTKTAWKPLVALLERGERRDT